MVSTEIQKETATGGSHSYLFDQLDNWFTLYQETFLSKREANTTFNLRVNDIF